MDSVAAWLERKPGNRDLVALRRHCGHLYVKSPHGRLWDRRLTCRIQLHQPTAEAIALLVSIAEKQRLVINLVHIALDLIVRDQSEANALADYFNAHLVKRWHGRHRVSFEGSTRYTSKQRWGVQQLVTYADRPSKVVPGAPCVHIEWRANGAPQVRSIGVKGPSDLLGLNLREFWQRRLVLEEVRADVLGRQALKMGRSKKVIANWYGPGIGYSDWAKAVGTGILRGLARRQDGPSAQEVRDWAAREPWCRVRGIVRRLPTGPFLPQ